MNEPELPEEFLAAMSVSNTPAGMCRCKLYDHLHPEHDDKKAS